MSIDSSKVIQITHVINPHLFWFKLKNTENAGVEELESALKIYATEAGDEVLASKSDRSLESEPYVAVYLNSKEKWIRAEIDDSSIAANEVIVWASDYGIPLKKPMDSIILLNDELKSLCQSVNSNIIKGGISDIFPSTHRVASDVKVRIVQSKRWEQRPIDTLQKIANSPEKILFTQNSKIENHVFGTLELFHHSGKIRPIAEILAIDLKCGLLIESDRFKRDIPTFDTFKINRWLNNELEIWVVADDSCRKKSQPKLKPFVKPVKTQPTAVETIKSSAVNHGSRSIDQDKMVREQLIKIKYGQSRKAEQEKVISTEIPTTSTSNGIATNQKQIQSNEVTSSSSTPKVELKAAASAKEALPNRPLNAASTTVQSIQTVQEENVLINKLKQIRIFTFNNQEEPNEFNSANFTAHIFKGMKYLNMQETYISQAYAWPNLLRGNSLVLVDSQKRGKTIAFLPAVCSLVERAIEENGKNKKGTTAIIVCLTASVPRIAALCRNILQMHQFRTNVVEAIGTRDAVSVTVKLFNGCNILVTTAPCLKELISSQNSLNVIKSDKLRCIAFENIDCIMDKHADSCNEIIKEMCLRKSYKGELRQFIVTSRTWKPFLEKFLNEKLIADSVLIIGNHLESALWAGVDIKLILCQKEQKLQQLTEQIKSTPYLKEKTLIVCNQLEESKQVAKHLESNDVPVELVKNIHSDYGKSKVKSFWSKMEGVLICDDEQLNETAIKDAHHVLHYTIPTEDFRTFLFRLSAMLDSYRSAFDSKDTRKKLTSTVLIDNDNYRQLPKFVDLVKRFGQSIPKNLREISEGARKANINDRARDRCYEPICGFVFMHGSSDHFSDCADRHMILQEDFSTNTNQITNGTLRFHVSKIISPTEYIVRPTLLKSDGEEWNVVNSSNEFVYLDTRIQVYYRNADNLKCLAALKLGEKCVVEYQEKFYRGEIIRINPKRQPTDAEKCLVRFVDSGEVQWFSAHEVFSLTEEFGTIPNQAYTLHLTGVIPADKEEDWDPSITEQIKKELIKWTDKETQTIFEANVLFALRNTLVVDIMRLVNLSRGVVHCSLKSYLQKRNYGIISPESSRKVIDMAKSSGVKVIETRKAKVKQANETSAERSSVPNTRNQMSNANANESIGNDASEQTQRNVSYDSNESTFEEEINEKWACPWKIQHTNVDITIFHSPDNLYVAQKSEKTRKLYQEVDKYAREHIESARDESLNTPDVDMPCLANVEGRFFRGKIIDVFFDIKCDLKVFLVDTGETVQVDSTNVFEIPEYLVEMCAYQAIWCNLIGIKPIGNRKQWTEEEKDKIYDEIDLNYGDNLYLHTIAVNESIESPANITRYDIILMVVRDHEQFCVNDWLVSLNLAEYDANTKHQLQKIPNLLEDDDSDSIDSDWEKEIDVNRENQWPSCNGGLVQNQDDAEDFEGLENAFVNFDEDELLEFIGYKKQSSSTPISTLKKIDEADEIGMESPGNNESSKQQRLKQTDNGYASGEMDGTDEPLGKYGANHQLEYIYKRPKVDWWQTEELLILRIGAHDNVQYGLEITSGHLIYGTKNANNEPVMAVMNFFGSVECDNVEHEVRGLNVIVRLRKCCPIMWPRLLLAADKCTWITQNMEVFAEEAEIKYDDQNSDPIAQDRSEDDSDGESEYKAGPISYDDSDDDLNSEE